MRVLALVALAAFVAVASADLYLQMPKGSNNYVDDANQAPANRLFDSQNNNNAGYNSGQQSAGFVQPVMYAGSTQTVYWTNQHGCGTNPKLHCEIILQYRCSETGYTPQMRNGDSRNQPNDDDVADGGYFNLAAAGQYDPDADRGIHEPYANWYACERRARNRGLFLADQNVGNQASSTRQNPNGGRSGYECAEERDYYPYWAPSYWVDVAVMTSNTSRCDYYAENSQNVLAKNYCSDVTKNNEAACTGAGAAWLTAPTWNEVEAAAGRAEPGAPDCVLAPWGKHNQHGNGIMPDATEATGVGLDNAHYNWTLPSTLDQDNCVIRLRYNMSTSDVDWMADSTLNGDNSPIEDDPLVRVLGIGQELELNINTNQFGRTFQDRSHVTSIKARPASIPDDATIWNLNVRGKRGNNQQTYPNCEYDFSPNNLALKKGDYVHFAWTGSDNNPQGTDRQNIMQMDGDSGNYPLDLAETTMFNGAADPTAFALRIARGNPANATENPAGPTDANLQDAAVSFSAEPIQFNEDGIFHFMSTKNNAFSNRSQKGTIQVGQTSSSAAAQVGKVLAISAGVAGAIAAGVVLTVLIAGGGGAVGFSKCRSSSTPSSTRF
jgi:hypothetical protein